MSMKTKNILLTMSILSVFLLTVVGITYQGTMVVIEETVADHQLDLVTDRAKATEIWLDQQMRILNATTRSIPYGSLGDNRETLAPLEMAMKAGHFSDVYIGLTNGLLIDGAGWVPPETYDPRNRPWYKEAETAGKTSFTTPYIDLVTMELVIALVAPLMVDDRLIGVMGADTVLDSLVETLLSTKVGETGYLFVANGNGTILIHPDRNYVMTAKLQSIEPALWNITAQFKNEPSDTIHYLHEGQENLLAYKQISNTDWFLCTSIPINEAYNLSRKTTLLFAAEVVLKVLGGLALLTLVGVGGSALMLYVSSRRFQSTIQRQFEEISGINEDLKWNISKRRDVETHYQTLFNVANDAILLSKDLQCVECNEKATEIFGASRLDLIGRSLLDFSPAFQSDGQDSQNLLHGIIEQADQGSQQSFVWTFQRSDDTEFPAEVGLKTLQLDNERLTLLSIRDISQRVNVEKQLRQAQKMAAMGEMLGAIAHQWRQPLNTLSTYIASLQSAYYNKRINADFVDKLTSNADIQIQFMSKTIDDFRHFYRPSKQKIAFDVVEAVASAVKLMQAQLKQSEIELRVEHQPPRTPLVVYGYQSEFVHVLVNILANARDAVEDKLKQDSANTARLIEISLSSGQSDLLIQIGDHGNGIPDHLLTRIFSPYFTTKGTSSGTGIGLYMAKIIIEKEMQGEITANNIATGAQFSIRLPKTAANAKE
jgi:PAS domain S-box-containing protein